MSYRSGLDGIADTNSAVLGIGSDLVDIDRFRVVLQRTPTLVDRLFCANEVGYAKKSGDGVARLAARFAAKEATLKSLGCGIGAMKMRDIEVVHHQDGHPELCLHGGAAKCAAARGAASFLITISHTKNLAQAVVVALRSG